MIRDMRAQADALARDPALRQVLRDEGTWLLRAQETLQRVQVFREDEMRRFWPAAWRRWAVAVTFALASAVAFGSGYVWASRPYDAELASLRTRVELLDAVAHRVLTMTPAERRQFDALMKWRSAPKR